MGRGSGILLSLALVLSFWGGRVEARGPYQTCESLFQAIPLQALQLRVLTYNVFDLKTSSRKGKNPNDVKKQAEIFNELNPDVLILEEVAGAEELEQINQRYLKGRYKVFFERGNDGRGFEIGMLVKKELETQFDIEYRSHRHLQFFDEVTGQHIPLFSRDTPTLVVKEKDGDRALFAAIGLHGKSKRDRPGDKESFLLRSRQMQGLKDIVQGLQKEFGVNTPVLIAGDFNTDIHEGPETSELLQIMTDVFDLLARPPPAKERITHTYHPNKGPNQYKQLDGILVSRSDRVEVENVQVYRYKNANGEPLPLPRSFNERKRQPSDHFPVYADLLIY